MVEALTNTGSHEQTILQKLVLDGGHLPGTDKFGH